MSRHQLAYWLDQAICGFNPHWASSVELALKGWADPKLTQPLILITLIGTLCHRSLFPHGSHILVYQINALSLSFPLTGPTISSFANAEPQWGTCWHQVTWSNVNWLGEKKLTLSGTYWFIRSPICYLFHLFMSTCCNITQFINLSLSLLSMCNFNLISTWLDWLDSMLAKTALCTCQKFCQAPPEVVLRWLWLYFGLSCELTLASLPAGLSHLWLQSTLSQLSWAGFERLSWP